MTNMREVGAHITWTNSDEKRGQPAIKTGTNSDEKRGQTAMKSGDTYEMQKKIKDIKYYESIGKTMAGEIPLICRFTCDTSQNT